LSTRCCGSSAKPRGRSRRFGQRFERQVARAATIRNVIESSARLVLVTFFVLFVLAQVGVNVTTLLAGVGILGLAISFGAQSLVKDVITGFFILAEDQFGSATW
jgi:small conductance mechanosensitive channel